MTTTFYLNFRGSDPVLTLQGNDSQIADYTFVPFEPIGERMRNIVIPSALVTFSAVRSTVTLQIQWLTGSTVDGFTLLVFQAAVDDWQIMRQQSTYLVDFRKTNEVITGSPVWKLSLTKTIPGGISIVYVFYLYVVQEASGQRTVLLLGIIGLVPVDDPDKSRVVIDNTTSIMFV